MTKPFPNDIDRLPLKLRLCSRYTGSVFGPVRESIRYNMNSAWGNRTESDRSGVELFTSYPIDICFAIGLAKANLPSSLRE